MSKGKTKYKKKLEKALEGMKRFDVTQCKKKRIGKGGFGTVYLITVEEKRYALKKFTDIELDSDNKKIIREFKYLHDFGHENIIKFCGYSKESIIENTPKDYSDLYSKCWSSAPILRPTLTQIKDVLDKLSKETTIEFFTRKFMNELPDNDENSYEGLDESLDESSADENMTLKHLDQSFIDELWGFFENQIKQECELIIKFRIIEFIKKYESNVVFEYLFNNQKNQNNQCLLGFFYYTGIGTNYDKRRALIFFSYAAEKGNKIASFLKESVLGVYSGTTNAKDAVSDKVDLEKAICYEIENRIMQQTELRKNGIQDVEFYSKELISWLLKSAFTNMKLTDLTEDEVTLKFLVTNSELPLVITVPDGVQVLFENTLIGRIPLEMIKFKPLEVVEFSRKFTILNKHSFAKFCRSIFENEKTILCLEGNTSIKIMSLNPINIKLCEEIELNGMKKLTINRIDAPSEHPDGGIDINMHITNTSHVKMELAGMFFDIKYMNQTVGEIFSTKFSHDHNTFTLSGRLLPQQSKDGLNAINNAFSKILTGEELSLVIQNNHASSVFWLQSSNRISLNVIISRETKICFDYKVSICELDIKFNPNDKTTPIVSSKYKIEYSKIFPLGINQISWKIGLFDIESQLATLSVPYTPVSDDSGIIEPKSNLTPINFETPTEDPKDLFNEFAKQLYIGEEITLTVKGEANIMAKTPVGNVNIENAKINFEKSFRCRIQSEIKPLDSFDVIGGTREHIKIEAKCTIINPSFINIDLSSNVKFELCFGNNKEKVADIEIKDFKLKQGENKNISVSAQYLPDTRKQLEAGRELIKNYLIGHRNDVIIKGTKDTTSIPLLKKAFEAIELKTSIPGVDIQFLNGVSYSLFYKDSFTISNPFKSRIRILNIDARIKVDGINIAHVTASENNIAEQGVVEKGETKTIKVDGTQLKIGNAIRMLPEVISKKLNVDIDCKAQVNIDDAYEIEVDYSQKSVKVGLGI
ncbi:22922_t:CDS:2 [Gigaspora margarita]|uniref:22922_t:CDS:1 n=1 Tax=Gigaspora margarita TaxID=4874 RepID=A0ABM8W5Y7_GIGMA|nr:22922_t:CDS:2 [Gigaspora margarita]